MSEQVIGKVTNYFDHLGVAVLSLEAGTTLKKGDRIRIAGHGHDFSQDINSLQVNHTDVDKVSSKDDFGLKVDQPVHEGDLVYRAE